MERNDQNWVTRNPGYTLLFLLTGILLVFFPVFLTHPILRKLHEFNTDTGVIGDTIGGTAGPVIALIGVALTFMAFYIQYQANKLQRADIRSERFENQFYEMLRLHKENVIEMEIDGKHSGRKVFLKMFQEVRFIYSDLSNLPEAKNLVPEELLKVAYHHMFWGVDFDRRICNQSMHANYESVSKKLCERIANHQRRFRNSIGKGGSGRVQMDYSYEHFESKIQGYFEPDFYPFDGHVTRLAHYYRHLFQMVKFIVGNEDLTWKKKYGYIKLLRAQLSNHEQVMIYFNAIWFDKPTWWSDENNLDKDGKPYRYLLDFALIKNVPFNLTRQLGPEVVNFFESKLGNGPFYKDLDVKKEISKDEKLKWLFEWTDK